MGDNINTDKKRTTGNVPTQPLAKYLPPSQLIWQGECVQLGHTYPCRVVLCYVWSLLAKAKEWEARPEYVFECAFTRNAMGGHTYTKAPLDELPAAFFEEVLAAFDRVRE